MVIEALGKSYVPLASHLLSFTPTSVFSAVFVQSNLSPVTVYTSTDAPSGMPSSFVLKLLVSWMLTTTKETTPSSLIAALTSSQGVSILPLIQYGFVDPSYSPL